MDYASLRQEGMRQLERLAGGRWTDFNSHDPGITLLEQLCYVLSDLGYRVDYDLPDLLADGGADPYASLPPAEAILPCLPVTPADLRRLVLDVEGVRNAWIEPVNDDTLPVDYLPDTSEIRVRAKEPDAAGAPARQPVRLAGLHRVLIEKDPDAKLSDDVLRGRVARRLHENRPLGEDFAEITVLKPQPIRVEATVEVAPVDDRQALLDAIGRRIAGEISPAIPFQSLADRLAAGADLAQIFDGPRLGRGFIADEVIAGASRRVEIHVSDLIHAITDVPGVRMVSTIRISDTDDNWQNWALAIGDGKVACFDFSYSRITLRSGGRILYGPPAVPARAGTTPNPPGAAAPALPAARNRNAGRYTSVQQGLPAAYGVGEAGLPESASDQRKEQARQLKAYLMFFDQILANGFAQLAHARELLSFDGGAQTYFAQALDPSGAARTESAAAFANTLQALVEPDGSAALDRKNRFLNHLLARFAEPIGDYAGAGVAERIERKQRMLRAWPRLSAARGAGFNCLAEGTKEQPNRSALEERLRIEQGISDLIVVEHILLRAMPGDEAQDDGKDGTPLLAAAAQADPYSLRLSFVLPVPDDKDRKAAQRRFEEAVREATPAHLAPRVLWLGTDGWKAFQIAHADWLSKRRAYLHAHFGIEA